jgi:LDH2 family malate/lactate/ureidoglycolate dehydrogenase
METVIVEAQRLAAACAAILQHEGVPAADAALVADSLVEADLKGTHSHGVLRLPRYVKELRSRVTNPAPRVCTEVEGESFARVDGDGGLGPLVGRYAMELCLAKAARTGTATVTARRSRHFGAAGYYAAMALPRDMIGIAMTVASPRLAPTGGIRPLFGNNPVAVAIPGDHGFPMVVDFAVGRTGAGRLELAAVNGEAIPPGLARDLNGNETTDPKVALNGAIIPIGEHKGYGMALVIEVLAGVLAGAPYFGVERDSVSDHMRDHGIGHCFMAIDPGRFMPTPAFKQAVAAMVATIGATPCLTDVTEVLVPGQLEARRLAERRRDGIPLSLPTATAVASLAGAAGASLTW